MDIEPLSAAHHETSHGRSTRQHPFGVLACIARYHGAGRLNRTSTRTAAFDCTVSHATHLLPDTCMEN